MNEKIINVFNLTQSFLKDVYSKKTCRWLFSLKYNVLSSNLVTILRSCRIPYLKKHETIKGENPPVGLILCTGKNPEHIELMHLDQSSIKVAEYFTVLSPEDLLTKKLRCAVAIARQRTDAREE